MRVRAYQQTAGLSSICLQTVIKGHPANLGAMYGRYVTSPNCFCFLDWVYSGYPNSSWCWIGTDPIHWPKILPPWGLNQHHISWYDIMYLKPYIYSARADLYFYKKLAKIWLQNRRKYPESLCCSLKSSENKFICKFCKVPIFIRFSLGQY